MGLEAIFGENVNINPVKLILGIMVVIYDVLFMVQHYVLYPEKKKSAHETLPLSTEHSM